MNGVENFKMLPRFISLLELEYQHIHDIADPKIWNERINNWDVENKEWYKWYISNNLVYEQGLFDFEFYLKTGIQML